VIRYTPQMARSSDLLQHWGMEDLEEAGSLTNAEVRRRRLMQLAAEVDGGLKAIAAAAEVSAQNLDHIIKRRRQSKPRADGSQPLVAMGDQLARDIERAAGKPPGWLDWPFEHVPFEAFAALNQFQQAAVEGQMMAAIKEAKGSKKMPAGTLKAPVSNKKVEKHFGVLSKEDIKAAHERAHRASRVVVDPDSPELRQRSLLDDAKKR
jgi:hypothetical protein